MHIKNPITIKTMALKTSFIVFLICIIVSFFSTITFADKKDYSQCLGRAVYYDDYLIEFDNQAYINKADVYVPLKELSNVLGIRFDTMDTHIEYMIVSKDGVNYVPLIKLINELDFSIGYDTEKNGMRISRDKSLALNEAGEIIIIDTIDLKDQGIILDNISTDTATLAIHLDEFESSPYDLQVLDMGGRTIYSSYIWQDKIVLKDLTSDTNYLVKLYKDKRLVFQKGFSTFSDRLIGNQVYYEISPWDFEKGFLKTTIFLYNNNDRSMTIEEKSAYPSSESSNIPYDDIQIYGVKHKIRPEAHRIDLELEGKKTAKITYDILSGSLNEHFLSTLFNPMAFIVDEDINNLIVNLNLPLSWGSAVGVQESGIDNLYKEIPDDAYNLEDTNIYAYHKDLFNVTKRQIGPSNVNIIVDKMYDDHLSEEILDLYFQQIFLWGDYPYEDTYSVFVLNAKEDIRNQGPKGQSWSYDVDWFSSAAQQMYYKWSGWEKGIQVASDHDFVFWNEGLSRYYALKLAGQLEQEDFKSELSNYYHEYMADYYWTKKDIAISDLSKKDESFLKYKKTTLFAYLLDKEIQEVTDGKKSLDDVLKYAWQTHTEDQIEMTESHFRLYIKEIVGTSMNEWWDNYMYYKRQFRVDEFEEG